MQKAIRIKCSAISLAVAISCIAGAIFQASSGVRGTGFSLQPVRAAGVQTHTFSTIPSNIAEPSFCVDNYFADDALDPDETFSQVAPNTGMTKNAYYIGGNPFSLVLRNYNTAGAPLQNMSGVAGTYDAKKILDNNCNAIKNIADVTNSSLDASWLMLSQTSLGDDIGWDRCTADHKYPLTGVYAYVNQFANDMMTASDRSLLKGVFVGADDVYKEGVPNAGYNQLDVNNFLRSANALTWNTDSNGNSKTKLFLLSLSEYRMIANVCRVTGNNSAAKGNEYAMKYAKRLLTSAFANNAQGKTLFGLRSVDGYKGPESDPDLYAYAVKSDGSEVSVLSATSMRVVPAANINLKQVVLCREASESAASLSPKNTGSKVGGGMKAYDPKAIHCGGGTKFVARMTSDDDCYTDMKRFTVSELDGKTLTNVTPNMTYTFNYSGAATGKGYYISAVIYDNSNSTKGHKILYEGRLKAVGSSESGQAEITIPQISEQTNGRNSYKLAVFEEKVSNAAYDGNIASDMSVADFSLTYPVSMSDCNLEMTFDGKVDGRDYFKYTGSSITPNLTLSYNGATLEEGVDYTVTCSENEIKDRGQYTLTITGDGVNVSGTLTRTFYVMSSLDDAAITVSMESEQLLQENGTPKLRVYEKYGSAEKTEVAPDAYSISVTPSWGVKDGSAVTLKGNNSKYFYGSRKLKLTARHDINDSAVEASYKAGQNMVYTGRPLRPEVNVLYRGSAIDKDHYEVSYGDNNTVAGGIVCTINGCGVYGGSRVLHADMTPAPITDAVVTNEADLKKTERYENKEVTKADPVLKVDGGKYLNTDLVKDRDFEVSYSDNNAIGSAMLTITGKGNFTGSIKIPFEIKGSSVANITVDKGKATIKAEEDVFDENDLKALRTNQNISEFVLAGENPYYTVRDGLLFDKKSGELLVIPAGRKLGTREDVQGLLTAMSIDAIPLSVCNGTLELTTGESLMVSPDGTLPKPEVAPLMLSNYRLVQGSDYTVEYHHDIFDLDCEVTVRGQGYFSGVLTKHFALSPTGEVIVDEPILDESTNGNKALKVISTGLRQVIVDSTRSLLKACKVGVDTENVKAELTIDEKVPSDLARSLEAKASAVGYGKIAASAVVKETVTMKQGSYDLMELSNLVTMQFRVPRQMQKDGRHYIVIRESDGEVVCSDSTDTTLSFASYYLGAYAVAYKDGTSTNTNGGSNKKDSADSTSSKSDTDTSKTKNTDKDKSDTSKTKNTNKNKPDTSKTKNNGKPSAASVSKSLTKNKKNTAKVKSPKTKSVSVKAKKKAFVITSKHASGQISGYRISYRKKGAKKWKYKNVSVKKNKKLKKKIKVKKAGVYQVRVCTYRVVKKKTYYSAFSKTKKVKVKK